MRDVPVVLVTAFRLFLSHWPALLTLAFLGSALRYGAVWGAVELSDVNGQLGQLLLILAPLGYLLPIVAMLAICRQSLPTLVEADAVAEVAVTERRTLRLVDVAVSVLVPFLAVYESYGLLQEDLFRFRNTAAFAETNSIFERGNVVDYQGRLGIYPLQIAVMIVVIAWVLRWALGRLERTLHFVALAFVGALAEVYYTSQLAGQVVIIRSRSSAWLEDRVAVGWFNDLYDRIVDFLGPVAVVFRAVVHFVGDIVGSLDLVLVVPIAWLTFGAVVLGFKLAVEESQTTTHRAPAPSSAVRRAGRSLFADVRERFTSLWQGLRLLLAAGLGPMLLFVVFFLVIIRLPVLVSLAIRAVVGPQEYFTALSFEDPASAFTFSLSMALTAPLLAAAIDWLVRTRTARRTEASPTTPVPA